MAKGLEARAEAREDVKKKKKKNAERSNDNHNHEKGRGGTAARWGRTNTRRDVDQSAHTAARAVRREPVAALLRSSEASGDYAEREGFTEGCKRQPRS